MSRLRTTEMLVAAVAASLFGVSRRRIQMTRTITWLSVGLGSRASTIESPSRRQRLLARGAAIG